MTTTVVYADTTDGFLQSWGSDYPTTRAGVGLSADTAGTAAYVGQQWLSAASMKCLETFLQFNTSAIGTDVISAVTLSLYGGTNASATDFIIEARIYNWGAGLTTADWVAGADLGSSTLVATWATSAGWSAAYNDFTDVALIANVNKTGQTLLMLSSDRQRTNTAPTGDEYVSLWTSDETGTTKDPKLTITHAPGGVARSQAVVMV